MKKIIIFSALCLLFFAFTAQAALVNCTTNCTWCDLMKTGQNVINFMMYLLLPIAAAMIVIGGISILTAGDSPQRVAKGKEIITAAVIGILIGLCAWLIIDTIFKIIAGQSVIQGIGRPWSQIKC